MLDAKNLKNIKAQLKKNGYDYPFLGNRDDIILDKKFKDLVLKNIPLGRLATESDVATAVVYLSSNASSMITGSSLVIDGGWTAK